MKVLVSKRLDDGGATAYILWPADPANVPTHAMAETDLRFMERWIRPVYGPHDVGNGRKLAQYRWPDIEPLMEELDEC